jgi:hypothetical protein
MIARFLQTDLEFTKGAFSKSLYAGAFEIIVMIYLLRPRGIALSFYYDN